MVNTTISISTVTRDMLRRFSHKGESYDEVITEMSKVYKKQLISEILMDDEDCISLKEFKRKVKIHK